MAKPILPRAVFLASLLALSLAPAALATESRAAHIAVRHFTLAPFGYIKFCKAHPADCRGGGANTIAAGRTAMTSLRRVNLTVNSSVRPQSEQGDTWEIGLKSGDCEDFALAKRRQLIREGFPPSALRIAVALTRNAEAHAVLVVRTDAGDLVLDNLTNAIMTWNETNLLWNKIASDQNPRIWLAI